MSIEQTSQRNRRLRKKLFVGEFTVYVFEVSLQLKEMSLDAFEQFVDEFIDVIEANHLVLGGSGDGTCQFRGIVASEKRYASATEEDRQTIKSWLEKQPQCEAVTVGALVDMNDVF
ncbi:YggL family protein [Hydrogenovibrio sp. 3SP14C1]|uniref:YggL 50S ribosome-binding family protein n=1 Tax=Hydrogenovibrio sp. 3SP14C1 TaxID=3038774 RepID=UPI0024180BCA|nr:YggL family protein [Hydrogenovibrio sp. 3SP14C1]MDG4813143.1 YggL family protein [Hydrogenovibrio sp. 3SP14C1]